ncbi:MAG: methionine synthase [Nitrospirota bacterium]
MFKPFNTTGIGSLPHTDPVEACNIILDSVDIPFWPQLPHRSFRESMGPQYSEGFPFVRIEGENLHVEQAEDAASAAFYEAIAGRTGFPISAEYAAGLHAFIDILKKRNQHFDVIKGHITGPLTFSLSLTDRQKRPIFFDDEMRELSLELLKGKASWQIDVLKSFADKVLIFVDEPILSALGTSTYIGVSSEEASRLLKEIVYYIHECGGIAGIHCCGKADWPLVLSSGIDVFNFDAFEYGDTLSLYPDEVTSFLNNKGYIAWGIVPTTEAIKEATFGLLKEKLENGLNSLVNLGVPGEIVMQQSLITPSCGTGSLVIEDALKAFSLLKDLRNSYVEG